MKAIYKSIISIITSFLLAFSATYTTTEYEEATITTSFEETDESSEETTENEEEESEETTESETENSEETTESDLESELIEEVEIATIGGVVSLDEAATIYEEANKESNEIGILESEAGLIDIEEDWLYIIYEDQYGYVKTEEVGYQLEGEIGFTVTEEENEEETSDTEEVVTIAEETETAAEEIVEEENADTEETNITEEASDQEATNIEQDTSNESESTEETIEATIAAVEEAVAEATYVLTTDYSTINSRMEEAASNASLYSLSKQMMSSGSVTTSDITAFLNYYLNNYSIVNSNASLGYSISGSTISLYNQTETESARQSTVATVINAIGVEQVTDSYQAVRDACSRIRAYLTYNSSYTSSSTITAYTSGQGVCVHYAIGMYIILNAEGIQCRLVSGTTNGWSSTHLWNEVYIDGTWYTVDACEFSDQSSRNPDGFVTSSYIGKYVEGYTVTLM